MAVVVVHFFPNGTKEQYEATLAVVHGDRNILPRGQIYHMAGACQGGWTVVAIHDSRESWERFRNLTLLPLMYQGIKGGFRTPPQEQVFEIYHELRAKPTSPSAPEVIL